MADIANAIARIEAASTFKLDTELVLNIVPGSIEYTPLRYDPIWYQDRGKWQSPLEGDDGDLSTLKLSVQAGALTGASLINKVLVAGTSGAPKKHAIVLFIPTNRVAATGWNATWTDAVLAKAPAFKAGARGAIDTWSFEFECGTTPAFTAVP